MISPKGVSPIAINKPPLCLASASRRRRDLLAQLAIMPDIIKPADIDETPYRAELPHAYAKRMAYEKAAKIAGLPDMAQHIILAADTIVHIGRRILPKAEQEEQAALCLALLSGRAHRVTTAICLSYQGRQWQKQVMTRVSMKNLDKAEIADYIAGREWQGKAGGYAIQGQAGRFIRHINGSYSNVIGLPLFETAALLRGVGFRVLS